MTKIMNILFVLVLFVIIILSVSISLAANKDSENNIDNSIETKIEKLKESVDILCNEIDILAMNINNDKNRISKLENDINILTKTVDNLSDQYKVTSDSINNTIDDTVQVSEKEETVVENNQEEILNGAVVNITDDPTVITNLSAQEFNDIILSAITVQHKSNSKLQDQGQALYDIEHTYGVNGIYALAVSSYETGYGTMGVSKNNLFGLTNSFGGYQSFQTQYDSIMEFGRLTKEFYFDRGLNNINSISKIYCEDYASWVKNVTWFIKFYTELYNSLN